MGLDGYVDHRVAIDSLLIPVRPRYEPSFALLGDFPGTRRIDIVAVESIQLNKRRSYQPKRRHLVPLFEEVGVVLVPEVLDGILHTLRIGNCRRYRIRGEGRIGQLSIQGHAATDDQAQCHQGARHDEGETPALSGRIRLQELLAHLVDIGIALAWRECRAGVDDLGKRTIDPHIPVGARATGEQIPQQNAQSVDVRTRIGLGEAILLGRRVGLRPEEARIGLAFLVIDARDIKVDQRHRTVRPHDHVGGLDVAMDDGFLAMVQVGEDVAQLHADVHDLSRLEVVLLRIALQRDALHIGAHRDQHLLVLE